MYLDFEAQCHPNFELRSLQSISIVGRSENGKEICKLKALRYAGSDFEIKRPDALVEAFDHHTAVAHNFACELLKRKRQLACRFGEDGLFANGLIAILDLQSDVCARGHRNGLQLIQYLKDLHAGMQWFVALQAVPQEDDFKSKSYLDMRSRLIKYYESDKEIGLSEISPKAAPGLMVGLWQ